MAAPLENRSAIITGASRGLGLKIAEKYVDAGADVLICAREAAALESARERLSERASRGQKIVARRADVSDARAAASLVEQALGEFGRLHILVSNAGIAGPLGPVESLDPQEWVRTIEINLLGAFHLSQAVLPHFKRAGYGKLIQLSGGGATNPLPRMSAYAASKAAVVRFMETLAEETRSCGIDVNCLAPGVLNTRILDELLEAGPRRIGPELHSRLQQQKADGGVPLDRGAELAVFLGSASSDGITGKLLSAVWDPWRKLPEHLEDLRSTDVYTLRRIVPRERNLTWEGAN